MYYTYIHVAYHSADGIYEMYREKSFNRISYDKTETYHTSFETLYYNFNVTKNDW